MTELEWQNSHKPPAWMDQETLDALTKPSTQPGRPNPNKAAPTVAQPTTATPQYKEGDTATGPNGEKMVYHNGAWGAA
jgi:hypothetical protein